MKKSVAIVGGGTAGLFLASFLDPTLFDIAIYEQKSSLGRKFLVAGDGGFNLTHSEQMEAFKQRYTPSGYLNEVLDHFTNDDLRVWLKTIGIPTFIGSSKRVYPEKGIKPISVLKGIQEYLKSRGVQFHFGKTFKGWNAENQLVFNKNEIVASDLKVFALGGGSWKVTGSDGKWLETFANKEIATKPFKAANCAFQIKWPLEFIQKNEGKPLKNISISMDGQVQKGEAVVTRFGIEGNAIYALSGKIQRALTQFNKATVSVDIKPMLSGDVLLGKLRNSDFNTTKTLKQIIKLSPTQIDLIKHYLSKYDFLDLAILAKTIKNFPLEIMVAAPLDEAISTTGGIDLDSVNDQFELINLKNNYCIGEMLDWNAPTGGYLIQACASMGVFLAKELNNKIGS